MNPTTNLRILVCVIVATGNMGNVKADFTFGPPVRVGLGLGVWDRVDCLSYDGLEMYISSYNRAGGQGCYDLWVLTRPSLDSEWGAPENLGPAVNSANQDGLSSISADGLTLYFCSDRLYGDDDRYDTFVSTRATREDPWGQAVNMGPAINGPGGLNFGAAWISPDSLELYIGSLKTRPGGYGGKDLYVARRTTTTDPWGEPVNLGPVVNTRYGDSLCSLSPDGLLLLFSPNWDTMLLRPDGYGKPDLYMARRASLSDPWQTPVNMGAQINGPAADIQPRISPDGRTLYFLSDRAGDWYAMEASIIPIVDFNADGKVDLDDLRLLIDNWGTAETLYDIGPYAWGDGKVDIEDLKVFIAEWEKANPPADP